ncbi:hypothetical protein [Enterococcus phage vB_Efs25_KEN11]|uniref:Uncharacterized protein n=1 Tax=Enterococcus phage vB_Efs6_KEN16 TaxID=3138325 RepID=A0AAX4PS17_9CAUD
MFHSYHSLSLIYLTCIEYQSFCYLSIDKMNFFIK